MKILYAIQDRGDGNLGKAKEVISALMNRAEIHVLVSGNQPKTAMLDTIKYRFKGIDFVFGKKGGINLKQTFLANNIFRIIREIKSCEVKGYDLVINDFEPISAWACYFANVKCISLSNQTSLLSKKVPKPRKLGRMRNFFLRNYAPFIEFYGFHFSNYDENIFRAIVRNDIRRQQIKEKNYYVVYLPAYSEKKIIKVLSKIKSIKWKVFSKECTKAYQHKNIFIKPIKNNLSFERSLAWSKGVLCSANLETPLDALYLKKKLMVIPKKAQYEQLCNAESLKKLGVPVINSLRKKHIVSICQWIQSDKVCELNFPDETQQIVDKILTNHIISTELSNKVFRNI